MVLGTGKQSLVAHCHAVDSKHPSYCLLGLSNRFNRRYDLAPLVSTFGGPAPYSSPILPIPNFG